MVATDPRLEAIAADVRRDEPDTGRLDIAATASAVGVEVRAVDLGRHLLATVFDDVIVLNSNESLTLGRNRFAFAHELAHILVTRGRMPWVSKRDEEWWADWFAHDLVLPRRLLADGVRTRRLLLFDDAAEHRTLALQLAALHSERSVLRIGDDVICSWCGESEFFVSCECRRYRDCPQALLELPYFVAPTAVHLDQLQLFETNDFPAALWAALVRRDTETHFADRG
jgi:hypothetical protein